VENAAALSIAAISNTEDLESWLKVTELCHALSISSESTAQKSVALIADACSAQLTELESQLKNSNSYKFYYSSIYKSSLKALLTRTLEIVTSSGIKEE
jgi:hypothetical protein